VTLIEILSQDAESMYAVTEALFRRVEPGRLEWKPATGENWMTVGQLLAHCAEACGPAVRGFLTGDWGLPEGMRFEDLTPEQMLPPASALASVASVEEALERLARDRELTASQLCAADTSRLLTERSAAPWGGREITLFQHLANMVGHLGQHKGQLFYYLKLMGQKVDTADLWGV
jgi:uncharacterized damage-inducible protein DinB